MANCGRDYKGIFVLIDVFIILRDGRERARGYNVSNIVIKVVLRLVLRIRTRWLSDWSRSSA